MQEPLHNYNAALSWLTAIIVEHLLCPFTLAPTSQEVNKNVYAFKWEGLFKA